MAEPNHEGSESSKLQEIALMLDIDGVITEPNSKKVNNEIVSALVSRLEAGDALCLFTGRAYEWARERVIKQIEANVSDKSKLDNLFVSAEYGGINITFQDGQEQIVIDQDRNIPSDLKNKIRGYVSSYEGIFLDPQKHTMVSVEIGGGDDPVEITRQKTNLETVKKIFTHELASYPSLRLVRTEIAVDVFERGAGKHLAAQHFLKFLNTRRIEPTAFMVFGDSATDAEASDELARQEKNVSFIYVGQKEVPDKVYPVERSQDFFDKGTRNVLARIFKTT